MCHGNREIPKQFFTVILTGYVFADSEKDAEELVALELAGIKKSALTVQTQEISFDDILGR